MRTEDEEPRTVKPRKRTYPGLPVVAISGADTLDEYGEVGTVAELISRLPQRPPTLFASMGAAAWVISLNEIYREQYPTTWNWRSSEHERDIVRPRDGKRVATKVSTLIHFFGWKNGNYHKIIDPVSMYGFNFDKVFPSDDPMLVRLLRWGVCIRNYCAANGYEVRPTIGGISSQHLTDRRFYPHPRRKVSAKINQRARDELPGNHYLLNTEPTSQQDWSAYYIDQTRAHHYHARTLRFPDSNSLYAHGRFTDLAECAFEDVWPDFTGLYCLDLRYGGVHPKRRVFHWLGKDLSKRFVFSNELPHILDMGFRVTGVRAAWGSRHSDTGLNRFAEWAHDQLDCHDDAPWLKPLLLSTYGVLAIKPRYAESVFRLAKSGEEVTLYGGRKQMTGLRVTAPRKLEPGIANVIHRGMIEAATRSESIGLAQHLYHQGHRLLSIYADAIIVEHDDGLTLPPLPEPWRIKRELTHLQFVNQQAFISSEMTKLPGVSREILGYELKRPIPSLVVNVEEEMEFAEGSFVRVPIHH